MHVYNIHYLVFVRKRCRYVEKMSRLFFHSVIYGLDFFLGLMHRLPKLRKCGVYDS